MKDCRNRLILKTPAAWHGDMWKDALPSGNGEIGASVYGGIKEETVLLNHGRLWHWGKRCLVPDVSKTLAAARERIDAGDYPGANALSSQALLDTGYDAELYKPCPLGDLKLFMHNESPFHHYRRELDMETGEVSVSWKQDGGSYRRSLFVSRADNLIAYELTATDVKVGVDIYLQLHDTFAEDTACMRAETGGTVECTSHSNYLFYAAQNEDGRDFGCVARIIAVSGKVETKKGRIAVLGADSVLVLLGVFANGERRAEFARLQVLLDGITPDYGALLKRHVALHGPLYRSTNIVLADKTCDTSNEELLLQAFEDRASTELVEKMWRYGRYLFISGTREDTPPFNMYGLWGGRYDLKWSHNMANINAQMIYWHASVGGYDSQMKGLLNYYFGMMNDFRENARKLFGVNGIYIPAGTTPGLGIPNQVVPVITNWIGAAGWLSQHFYEYYLCTRDEDALRDMILPFMLETAEFFEEYLVLGADELYTVYPSVSPENTPANFINEGFMHMGHQNPTARDATMDVAIIRELFGNLLELCGKTGLYPECLLAWETLLKRLPSYRVNADGAVSEWIAPELSDFYYHRHLSHLYPVFPGKEVGSGHPLLPEFRQAVELRVLGGQSCWSLAQMASIYARFGEGDRALSSIDTLLRSCLTNSFFTLHNDWRKMGMTLDLDDFVPVQMDANLGIVGAVQEMLLFVSQRLLRVLPACPAEWQTGKVEDFCFYSGKLSFQWDIMVKKCDVSAFFHRDAELTISLPAFGSPYCWDITGDAEVRAEGESFHIVGSSGARVKFASQSCVNGDLILQASRPTR